MYAAKSGDADGPCLGERLLKHIEMALTLLLDMITIPICCHRHMPLFFFFFIIMLDSNLVA